MTSSLSQAQKTVRVEKSTQDSSKWSSIDSSYAGELKVTIGNWRFLISVREDGVRLVDLFHQMVEFDASDSLPCEPTCWCHYVISPSQPDDRGVATWCGNTVTVLYDNGDWVKFIQKED